MNTTTTKTPAQAMTVPQKPVTGVVRRPKALEIMGEALMIDPPMLLQILKNQIMPQASDDEIAAFTIVCNVHGLNPILREIYAFPDPKRKRIVPVVGVDGWAKIVNRQEDYDGCEFEWHFGPDGTSPLACTCKLYHKKRSKPIVVTEYFTECRRNTDPWNGMPNRMLRHKAFIQAVRLAFGVAGIYDEDEARDIVGNGPQASAPAFLTPPELLAANPAQAAPTAPANVAPLPEDEPEPTTAQKVADAEHIATGTPPTLKVDPTAHLDSKGVLDLLFEFMKRDGVSEDQVLGHLKAVKVAKHHKELAELSDTKCRALAASWDRELPAIKAITI